MATSIQHTIDLLFRGEDQVTGTIDDVVGGLATFDAGVQAIADPFADIADGVLMLDAAIGVTLVAGIALAGAEAGKFNDQLRETNTLLQLEPEGLERFHDEILAAAQDLKAADLSGFQTALYNAVSLGLSDYKDALAAVSQAEKLAIAGKADLNDSLEFLLGTLNAYGEGVEEAGRYSDIFFTIVKDGKTTIPELSQSMADVTGIAAAAAVPMETLGAAIAAMTAAGNPTSQSITKIKAAIEGIINPTGQAREMAEKLGVSFSAQALEAKGLEGVLGDVYQATGGNIEQMSQLFSSSEALNAALVLGADKSGAFARALDDMGESAGATEQAFNEMKDNMGLAIQQFTNNLKVMLVRAGEELEGAGPDVIQPMTKLVRGIADAIGSDAFEPLFGMIRETGTDISNLLNTIADGLPDALQGVDYGPILDAVRDFKGEIATLFEGLDLSTPEGLAKALQWVADSIATVIRVSSGMVTALKPVIDTFLDLVTRSNEAGSEVAEDFGKILGAAKLLTEAGTLVGGFFVAIQTTGTDARRVLDVVLGSITTLYNGAQIIMDNTVSMVSRIGSTLLGTISTVVDAVSGLPIVGDEMAGMAAKLDAASGSLKTLAEAAEATRMENFREMMDGAAMAARGFSGEVDGIKKSIDEIPEDKAVEVSMEDKEAQRSLEILMVELEKAGVLKIKPEPDQEFSEAEAKAFFGELLGDKSVAVGAEPDREKLDYVTGIIEERLPDGTRYFTYQPEIDQAAVDEAARTVNEALPDEKILRIQTDLEIAKLEADTERMQSYLEFKAEVDVAEIEAAAEIITTLAEGASAAFQSTGEVISAVFSQLAGLGDSLNDTRTRWLIEDQLERENDLRERALKLQEELTRAQIEYMEARQERMAQGDPLITVKADGLEPHLQNIWMEIIRLCQVEATAEGAEFLIGL